MITRVVAACLALSALAGCAHPGEDRLAEKDPLQGFNRAMWGVNETLDKYTIKPVSSAYRAVTPPPARHGFSRLFANLEEPFSFANNLLQGKPKRAMRNLGRFVINTTIGVGGLADHATEFGIQPAKEDFGQTMAVWGMNGGPYLVLPLLGPTTMRDGVGLLGQSYLDPWSIAINQTELTKLEKTGITAFRLVTIRSDLTESGADAFLKTSLDPYAAAKSAYLQQRHADIRDRDVDEDVEDVPDDSAAPAAPSTDQPTGAPITGGSSAASPSESTAPASSPTPPDSASAPKQ
jgi:phospholipid-binding lipoprotein MlaA